MSINTLRNVAPPDSSSDEDESDTTSASSRNSMELVNELTSKLLQGKKEEVFSFLQTLPTDRAQRVKEKLIRALKSVPPSQAKPRGKKATARSFSTSSVGRPTRNDPRKKKGATGYTPPVVPSSAGPSVRTSSAVPAARKRSTNDSPSSTTSRSGSRELVTVAAGRYILGECLGKGNFGKVYRALDKTNGTFVAIKEIQCEKFGEKESSEIMLEADLLGRLNHKHIVRFFQFDQTDKYIYFVMELISSGSLYHTLEKFGSFTERLTVIYIIQVLRGLRYLHKQNIVHGDIKADNILLTKDGMVKLVDFGTAALLSAKQDSALGTPFWMAPEIINMEGAVPVSDIWSLGCTIIELLDGKPPFFEHPPMTALFKMVQEDHPPLPQEISDDCVDFHMLCFNKDVPKRATAEQLLKHPWIQDLKPPDDVSEDIDDNDSSTDRRRDTMGGFASVPQGARNESPRDKRNTYGVSPGTSRGTSPRGSKQAQAGQGGDTRIVAPRIEREIESDEEFLGSFDFEEVQYPNGDRYRGEIDSRGKRNGRGIYTMKNGTVYKGEFDSGKPHGFGMYTYPNGDVYIGGFDHDIFEGVGRYVSASGMLHEGVYTNGKRHGPGRMTTTSGSVFEGEYQNDVMHGWGCYKYSSGDVYTGNFENNKFHGKGEYTFASNGSKINGQFAEGKPVLKK